MRSSISLETSALKATLDNVFKINALGDGSMNSITGYTIPNDQHLCQKLAASVAGAINATSGHVKWAKRQKKPIK